MMRARMTTKAAELARLQFAESAAEHFAANPDHTTFGTLAPGSFLALRWGLGEDCVLTVKLDELDEPVNYQQIIKRNPCTQP